MNKETEQQVGYYIVIFGLIMIAVLALSIRGAETIDIYIQWILVMLVDIFLIMLVLEYKHNKLRKQLEEALAGWKSCVDDLRKADAICEAIAAPRTMIDPNDPGLEGRN